MSVLEKDAPAQAVRVSTCPSSVQTGSRITSSVIGHTNSAGTDPPSHPSARGAAAAAASAAAPPPPLGAGAAAGAASCRTRCHCDAGTDSEASAAVPVTRMERRPRPARTVHASARPRRHHPHLCRVACDAVRLGTPGTISHARATSARNTTSPAPPRGRPLHVPTRNRARQRRFPRPTHSSSRIRLRAATHRPRARTCNRRRRFGSGPPSARGCVAWRTAARPVTARSHPVTVRSRSGTDPAGKVGWCQGERGGAA